VVTFAGRNILGDSREGSRRRKRERERERDSERGKSERSPELRREGAALASRSRARFYPLRVCVVCGLFFYRVIILARVYVLIRLCLCSPCSILPTTVPRVPRKVVVAYPAHTLSPPEGRI